MKKTHLAPIILFLIGILLITIFFIRGMKEPLSFIWIGLGFIFVGIIVSVVLFVWNVSFNTKSDYSKNFDRKLKKIFPRTFYEKLGKKLFPKYNEIILFALAITVFFLFFVDKDFNQKMIKILFEDGRIFFALLLGLSASFYHFFSKKKKTQIAKKFMSFFLIFFSCFVCFFSIKFTQNIFSFIISMINSVYLFFVILSFIVLVAYKSPITEELVDDYEPNILEKIFSFFIIIGFFYTSYFFLKINWIITMSIMVFYTNLLHKGFSRLLFTIKK